MLEGMETLGLEVLETAFSSELSSNVRSITLPAMLEIVIDGICLDSLERRDLDAFLLPNLISQIM